MKTSILVLLAASISATFNCLAQPIYGLFLGREYYQIGTFSMPSPERVAYWEAWVQGTDPHLIEQVQVRPPTGAPVSLPRAGTGAYLTRDFASEVARGAAFPDGDYQLSLTRTDGSTGQVSWAQTAASYPPAPQMDPFQILVMLPPGVDVDLRLTPSTGALASDYLVVSLVDGAGRLAYTTPWPGQPGALNGRSSQARLPGAVLAPQQVFILRITAYRLSALEMLPNGVGTRVRGMASTVMTTLMVDAARGQELAEYRVVRGRSYAQDSDAPPRASAQSPFFEAAARGIFLNHITNVTVHPPGGALIPLQAMDSSHWGFQTNFSDDIALLAAFPDGSYGWTVQIEAGETQRATNRLESIPIPPPLQVLDWSQLQTNSLTNDVIVDWLPAPGARAGDQIELLVLNGHQVVFRAPDKTLGELPIPGTVTQITIPADTLNPYAENQARLRYLRTGQVDTVSVPKATGMVGACSETRFAIGSLDAWPLVILTTELSPAEIGQRYVAPISSSGGRKPFSWSITSGPLPTGLEFDAQRGLISGVPLVSGEFPLTVEMTDTLGNRASQSLSLSVTGQLEAVTIVNTELPVVLDGLFYKAKMTSRGGVAPRRWSVASGRLPPGLQLDPASGMLFGFAEETGTFSFELQVEDRAGQIARRNFALAVPSIARSPVLRFRAPVLNALGQLELSLQAPPGTLCTIEASPDLKIWQPVLVTNLPPGGKLPMGPRPVTTQFYRIYHGPPRPAPNPLTVVAVADIKTAVEARLTAAGVSMELTNAAGQTWRLVIPPNAAYAETTIRMSSLQRVEGLPFEGGLLGGVQLEPEGLMLRELGWLTATLPGPVPEDLAGFAYDGKGDNLHLYPVTAGGNTVSFPIQHFSGYGSSLASDQSKQSNQQRTPCLTRGQVAARLATFLYEVAPILELELAYTELIAPKLEEAKTDDTRIREVEDAFLYWESLMRNAMAANPNATGSVAPPAELLAQGWEELAMAYHNGINLAETKCVTEHRPWRMMRVYELLDRATEIGLKSHLTGQWPNLDESVILEDFKNNFRFELEVISNIEVTSKGGGYFNAGVFSDKAEFVPKRRPVVKHSFDAFEMSSTNLLNDGWELREKKNRIKPVIEKGKWKAVSLALAGLNWPDKNDRCGNPVPAWGDPLETRIACQFEAEDPVPRMKVRDAKGVWREVTSTTTWWNTFKLAHGTELLVFSDETGARREVVKPKEGKWKYQGGALFAIAEYNGTPEIALGVGGGTITETTFLRLYHAPE